MENTIESGSGETEVQLNEVKASSRHISPAERYMLWGRAAGRCQFRGCNKPLWKHPETQEAVNIAEAAHIYSFSEDGPRGNEGIDVEDLNTSQNLLLACHDCHKTIDTEQAAGMRYPVELLQGWKAEHEQRVERVTGIDPGHKSHVVLYGRAINGAHSPIRYDKAASAMFPLRHPAENFAIELSSSASDSTERDAEFWQAELKDLERKFGRKVQERLEDGEIEHMSVFALSPMPLLIRLGTLLTEIRDVDVYQLHRDSKGWAWPSKGETIEIKVEKPCDSNGPAALVLALSATVDDARIQTVLGETASIWRVTISQPNHVCIRSRGDLAVFCNLVRPLLDEIKAKHGHGATLSIFPAAPVSTMVELGRVRQPKADMDWVIFDENRATGGFSQAIKLTGGGATMVG